ncbi:MAG: hypothetical protein H6893_13455 [Brucellaceae bacterium]|nr:hypothetical protein [Brucellaceae bacterium]
MPDKHQAELASLLQSLCDLQERATRLELKFLGSLLEAAIIETALQGESRRHLDDPETGVDILLGMKLRIAFARGKTNILVFPRNTPPGGRNDGGTS